MASKCLYCSTVYEGFVAFCPKDKNKCCYVPDECLNDQPTFQNNTPNIPKCPTCSSTNISKISTASKIVGGAMFGLLSKTAKSQFKCNNCGYKW